MWKKSEGEEPQIPAPSQPPVTSAPRVAVPKPPDRSAIGPTIFINGDLKGEEDLLIEGRVEGKIELKQNSITIGKSGRVKADIYGKTISIEGEVQGNMYGEERLALRQSSNVRGNIVAPRVTLEDGCRFKGSIDMCPDDGAESRPAQVKTSESTARSGREERPGEAVKPVVLASESASMSALKK